MRISKQRKIFLAGLVVAMLSLTVGCSKAPKELTAAPLGDRAVLQSLADSYTEVSDNKLTVSPMNLSGEDRKQFVTEVFANSGYSYDLTLFELAKQGIDKNNQLYTDMAELLLMPHRSPRIPVELTELYSGEELKAVAVIERQLNMR